MNPSKVPEPPVPLPGVASEIEAAVEELHLYERAAELDRTPRFPREEFRELGRRGLLGLHVPPEVGGRGLPLPEVGAALYRMAYLTGATTFAKLSLQPEFASVLAERGASGLVDSEYRALCRGERLIGNHVTEPGAGSDARGISMTAVRGPDGYRLTGTKSQAAFAVDADSALVYAKVPPHSGGPGGVTAFLVPQDAPGIQKRLIEDLGERWMRRGSVQYEAVEVALERRVGEEGRGFEYVLPELTRERPLLAMIYLGVARRTLEETVHAVGEREAFGRPLSGNQAISFPLVADWARGEAATLYAIQTLRRLSVGLAVPAEAALAKWMATEVALELHDHAIQFHGGRGYSNELPFERRWRDVRSGGLAHGPSEIMLRTAASALWPPERPKGSSPENRGG